ncbi:MAG: RidA family protein [Chloroflexi bacterium]|nr:RidA family protein [Chloroflexota bacterium]MBP8057909.1 RidA family protein [Chloroflexota bacterium]
MLREIIHTTHAPAAVGPYSQAIRLGNLVFTSGQIALDPSTGKLVEGDVVAQTHQVMKNLQSVLAAAATDLSQVIKTTVFLQNMGDFPVFNQTYAQYFSSQPPARSTVEVTKLPLGGLVEIECIALIQE